MKKRHFTIVHLGLATILSIASAQAQTLATWDVAGANASTTSTLSPTSLASGVTGGVLSLSSAIGANTANTFGFSVTSAVNSEAAARLNGNFFQFTLTAGSGVVLNLSELSIHVSDPSGSSKLYTNSFIDVVTVKAGVSSSITTFLSTGPTTGYFPSAISLTGLAQGVDSVNFKVYGYRGDNSGSLGSMVVTNTNPTGADMTVRGTIPEISSSLSLGILLAIPILGFRQRRS